MTDDDGEDGTKQAENFRPNQNSICNSFIFSFFQRNLPLQNKKIQKKKTVKMKRRLSGGKADPSSSTTQFKQTTFKTAINSLKLILQTLDENKINSNVLFEDCEQNADMICETVNVLLSVIKNKCPPQAFISHHEAQSGTSVQLLKSRLENNIVGLKCFLNSHNLENLNLLSCHVLMSSIFYLMMSPKTDKFEFGPFNCPHCLIEILSWYLNKDKMKCVIVFQKQDGMEMTRFPISQQETNQLIPSSDVMVVENAIGRKDVLELVWKAIQEMKKQICLVWNPTHSDQSELQLKRILESTGMPLKTEDIEEETSGKQQNGDLILKTTIICCRESENEAVLLRDRTKIEFENQIEIEVNKNLENATFGIVLLTPALLNDKNGLEMISFAIKKKCNLIPITISRIGLPAFDFQKQAIIHQDSFKM